MDRDDRIWHSFNRCIALPAPTPPRDLVYSGWRKLLRNQYRSANIGRKDPGEMPEMVDRSLAQQRSPLVSSIGTSKHWIRQNQRDPSPWTHNTQRQIEKE